MKQLTKAREIRGLTQNQLALLCGIPSSSISHFENGDRKPAFKNIMKLSEVLEVSSDFLLDRSEQVKLNTTATEALRALEFIGDTHDSDIRKEIETVRSYIRQTEKRLIISIDYEPEEVKEEVEER